MLKVHLGFFLLCFSSFLSLINPLASAPIFSSLMERESKEQKRRIAFKASMASLLTLVIVLLMGEFIFKFFGITVHGFRIAGGILFFGIGYEMLQAKDSPAKTTEDEQEEVSERTDFAVTPLAIPMLCGPGAISNAMILARDAKHVINYVSLVLSIVLVCGIIYYTLISADRIVKFLGPTGMSVTKRVMGLIVMVIAVEFIIAGTTPVLKSLFAAAGHKTC